MHLCLAVTCPWNSGVEFSICGLLLTSKIFWILEHFPLWILVVKDAQPPVCVLGVIAEDFGLKRKISEGFFLLLLFIISFNNISK